MPRFDAESLPRRDLKALQMLFNSSNSAMIVELESSPSGRGVYKPMAGERPLWDFPEGTLCCREVAASLVAEEVGFPHVPTTVLVDGSFGVGALAPFVEFQPDLHFFGLRDRHPLEMRKIAAFDVVVNNADRKAGHVAMAADGRIIAFDHGLCFHVEPKLRTVIWDYVGEPLPQEVIDGLVRLDKGLAEGSRLKRELMELLEDDEIEALRQRNRDLLVTREFPAPISDPIYPWPPI